MAGSGFKSQYGNLANERASEPTRAERGSRGPRDRVCRGVRGAKPLGVIKCLAVPDGFISWVSVASA